ncbi:hypothetical protein BDZ91DRAFT_852635 [Kalaharituber pfeilii]|nr:hypothetical protein BDZ91DRAFT_852635 [Kalaharituber pfeilii]
MSGDRSTLIPTDAQAPTPLGNLPATSIHLQSSLNVPAQAQPSQMPGQSQRRQRSVGPQLQAILRAIARLLPEFQRVSEGSDDLEARETYDRVLSVLQANPQRWARLMQARSWTQSDMRIVKLKVRRKLQESEPEDDQMHLDTQPTAPSSPPPSPPTSPKRSACTLSNYTFGTKETQPEEDP